MRLRKTMVGICFFLSMALANIETYSQKPIEMTSPKKQCTLVVTSTTNPEQGPALQQYVQGVMPMLMAIGGQVIKRSKIDEAYWGKASFEYLLVMDFPSREQLVELFDSAAYMALIPDRNKAFSEINILFADNLE